MRWDGMGRGKMVNNKAGMDFVVATRPAVIEKQVRFTLAVLSKRFSAILPGLGPAAQ